MLKNFKDNGEVKKVILARSSERNGGVKKVIAGHENIDKKEMSALLRSVRQ